MTTGNTERLARIRAALTESFAPEALEVLDESHLHAGHAGAQDGRGHFRVRIVATAFNSKPPIQSHRLIYSALGTMMQTDIHALAIEAQGTDQRP